MSPNAHLRLLLKELPTSRLTRIVDVGANPANVPPYQTLLRLGGCDVIGFEPAPEAYRALAERNAPHETYVNAAVGDGSTKAFKVYKDESFSSIFAPDLGAMEFLGSPQWGEVAQTVDLATVSLDQVPECADIDLLKIDIQGGEQDVFRGARAVLAKAVAIITELRYFPLYQDEPMMGDQALELRAQGFELHKLLHMHARCLPSSQRHLLVRSEVKDQMIDGDAVFLRNLVKMAELTDEKLMHLCILAATVFNSHSLVLNLLDVLVARGAVAADLPAGYVAAMPARLVRAKARA